jgi:hypothetical protein
VVMTWTRLPAPARRRITVLLGQLARRALTAAAAQEDHGRDRPSSREEGRDGSPGEDPGPPP